MQLWRELRECGLPGTVKQIRRWLSERRTRPARTTIRRLQTLSPMVQTAPPSPPLLPSPKQLSWHLLREPADLDPDAASVAARVLQDEEAAKVVDLGRRFCRIVRGHCGVAPTKPGLITAFAWLSDARTCSVRVVESFAASLGQDGAAVRAALRLP
jgi:hypothetical protein